jgi:hypothetical protein
LKGIQRRNCEKSWENFEKICHFLKNYKKHSQNKQCFSNQRITTEFSQFFHDFFPSVSRENTDMLTHLNSYRVIHEKVHAARNQNSYILVHVLNILWHFTFLKFALVFTNVIIPLLCYKYLYRNRKVVCVVHYSSMWRGRGAEGMGEGAGVPGVPVGKGAVGGFQIFGKVLRHPIWKSLRIIGLSLWSKITVFNMSCNVTRNGIKCILNFF